MVAEDGMAHAPVLEFALAQLLSPEPRTAQQGVEEIMSEVQVHRDRLVGLLLRDERCKHYLAALCNLLAAPDHRLCSSVAFILGTVAEDPSMCALLVDLAGRSTNWDLLGRLGAMLLWEDTEAVMNAAGALGTLAENSEGRRWILAFPGSNFIIENIAELLASPSDWTASNCALVLARICMSHEGCARILDHPESDAILRKLMASLHVDEAGCGLNAAFALGRLCDTDLGRKRVLGLREAEAMVSALEEIMSSGDAGGSRNACFAVTCLATDQAGHQHVLRSPSFSRILDALCRLLQSEEQESCWFAAMTVKVLSRYSQGVVRLRQHQFLEETLKRVAASHAAGKELLEEVQNTLENLQRLPQPPRPTTKVLDSGSIWVGWEEHAPSSGLPVTYSLFDRERLLYQGPSCTYMIVNPKPGHQYRLKVVMQTTGDLSPDSPVTVVTVDEPLPGPPLNLQVTGRTATKVKLSWSPPAESGATIKGYMVYREEIQVETTPDPSCIIGGLSPFSSYTFSVCAWSSRGQGEKSSVVARTVDKGDHAPGRPTLYVIGRSEIFITWEVPRDPLGRFFNYELCVNGKPVYLGTERSYTARRLISNTEYTCTVCAITSEGRFETRPVTKRTAKDEYSNLSKHHVATEGHQLVISLPTRDNQNPPHRQHKTDGPAKQSPAVKNPQARLLMSNPSSKSKDKKTQAPNSRRGSWSTESTEDNGGLLQSQTQSPKQWPVRASDATCHKPSQPGSSDNKKPQSANILRLLPVASLKSLVPEYLVHQRAKKETAPVQPSPLGRHEQHIPESSQESDKERSTGPRKTLQPLRDPLQRPRHQNLPGNAWDVPRVLTNERRRYSFPGKYLGISSEEEKTQLAPPNAPRKNGFFSKPPGPLELHQHTASHFHSEIHQQTASHFHSELSRIQSFQRIERKTRKPFKGHRIGGSLPDLFYRDVVALVGESGVTFRLPPASNHAVTPQRVRQPL